MRETTIPERIETTLLALAVAIQEVACSDADAFAVLETTLAEGRISLLADDRVLVSAMDPDKAA